MRFAVSEERLSRIKNHSGYYHGFPERSLDGGLRRRPAGRRRSIDADRDLELRLPAPPAAAARARAQAGPLGDKEFLDRHEFSQTLNSQLYSLFSERRSSSSLARASISVYRRGARRASSKREFGLVAPIVFVDHHRCHAASAYFTQPEDDCIVFTLDCHGDGLSGSVSLASEGRLRADRGLPAPRLARILLRGHHATTSASNTTATRARSPDSRPTRTRSVARGRHAAHDLLRPGDPAHRTRTSAAISSSSIARIGSFSQPLLPARGDRRGRAGAPRTARARDRAQLPARRRGARKVLLAGGVFGNVKLNQRINQLPEVEYLFVHPGMGDEGLPVGAALACSAELGAYRCRAHRERLLGAGLRRCAQVGACARRRGLPATSGFPTSTRADRRAARGPQDRRALHRPRRVRTARARSTAASSSTPATRPRTTGSTRSCGAASSCPSRRRRSPRELRDCYRELASRRVRRRVHDGLLRRRAGISRRAAPPWCTSTGRRGRSS